MKLSKAALLALLGLVVFAAMTPVAYADDEEAGEEAEEEEEEEEDYIEEGDVDEHPLTDMPLPSPEVLAAGLFPNEDPASPRFAIGEPVDAVVGLVNNGQEAINVTMIMGSLNSPFDFNYFIQNFSGYNYNTIVQEGEEFSFHYRFQTAINLDPVDYQVALTVFYENEDELFSHTFFNASVNFYEEGALVDFPKLFKGIGGFAAVALFIVMCKKISDGSDVSGAASSNGATNGAASNGGDDWSYGDVTASVGTANRKFANKGRRSGKKKRN